MRETITEDDWRAIVDKAILQATMGIKDARDFLTRYCMPPPNAPDDDGEDIEHEDRTPLEKATEIIEHIRRNTEGTGRTVDAGGNDTDAGLRGQQRQPANL